MKKIIGILLIFAAILAGCSKEPTPQERFTEYIALWNQQKFDKMYVYLSTDAKQKISQKAFTNRYQKIYKDLQITDLKIDFKKPKDNKQAKEDTAAYTFSAKMNSIAGEIQFSHQAHLKKEEKDKQTNWYVDWDSAFIFPKLMDGDTVGITTTAPERGEIFDRNGNGLAVNGQVYEVGVIPGKLGAQKDQMIQQLSTLLKLSPDQINTALGASWVKPDLFVPLKKVSMQDSELIAQLIKLEPVQTKKVGARIYPYTEAAAHLIGYVGPITADELAKLKGKGYMSNDIIGKRGLEQVYDRELRGTSGVKVTIKKKAGGEEVLAEKPVVNGKQLKLTIDVNLQVKLFNELSGEAGSSAAMNPITGDMLALVSSPSFDPNQAALGYSSEEWKALQDNPQQPLTTRFKQAYAPGSVMKPITASIGLESKAITPEQSVAITSPKWQKDASWGGYFVTRVHESNPVNLEKALVFSDNIYFAQAALKIGKDTFVAGLKNFGFDSEFVYPFPLETSKIGTLGSEIALADSGYGQGQIQMSIVHLMAAYTPFVNGGNMIKPVLLMDDQKSQVLKPSLVSSGNAALISGILRKVVGDPSGTAHAADIPGYPLSGKTGTAEIKQKQGQTGTENGWFIAYNTNLMIAMMVENVQGRGGSQVPVTKVRDVFAQVK
ncbi:penicillin-binding transpeptidase domain-containing protein [Neobacillus ginsengisoli]|uniref:serine-type D-Ala-D-Ala carboxypeptidase n=1 Tax=Neobacillus ginsengisoli TaxID=904295 RepID=A0ABT9XZC7_9BACI|nr:penicillin-binding protein [Neobacillus ginsengisoli]